MTTAGAGGPAGGRARAGSKQRRSPPLPRAVASEAFGGVKTSSPKSGVEGGWNNSPTLHPRAMPAPRPEGLTRLARGSWGGAVGSTGLGSQPAPSDSRPGGGRRGERGGGTHTHTPHAARAREPRPGAGGGGFPRLEHSWLLFTFLASPGDQEPAPALRRPPPPAAAPRLPAPGARAHTHTRTHTHPPCPAAVAAAIKHPGVLRLRRPRRPADVKLQLGWCSS